MALEIRFLNLNMTFNWLLIFLQREDMWLSKFSLLCNYTKPIILLKLGEYWWIITNIHFAFGE
jgi:hypothetical protein